MNLAYGRNPWARAELSDDTFRAFASDPEYLTCILPIPPPVQAIFRGLFALDPSRRMSLAELHRVISEVECFMLSPQELQQAKPEARNVALAQLEIIAARQQKQDDYASIPKAHSAILPDHKSSLVSPIPDHPSYPFTAPPIAPSSPRIRRPALHLMFRRATSPKSSTGSDSSSMASCSSSPSTPESVESDYFPSPPPIARQARVTTDVIIPGESRRRHPFVHSVPGSIDEEDEAILENALATHGYPSLISMAYKGKEVTATPDPLFSDPRLNVLFPQ